MKLWKKSAIKRIDLKTYYDYNDKWNPHIPILYDVTCLSFTLFLLLSILYNSLTKKDVVLLGFFVPYMCICESVSINFSKIKETNN